MSGKNNVCLVSADGNIINALKGPFKSAGLTLVSFASLEEFLKALDDDRSIICLITELQGNVHLLEKLAGRPCIVPVVFLAGSVSVTAAIQAMKAGAFDVVENVDAAVESARNALAFFAKNRNLFEERCAALRRIESLTKREKQVLHLMVAGRPNREIAAELAISTKTLDIHRANLIEKMHARTTADMCRAYWLSKTDPMHLHLVMRTEC